jgi:hypothetical protein
MIALLSSLFADTGAPLGDAFRAGLPFVLVCTAVLIVLHLVLSLVRRRQAVIRPPWSLWERLVYLVTLLSVAVLGVTSFSAVMRFGELHGWMLLAHMVGAGMFVLVLPLLAITWCGANRGPSRSEPEGNGDQTRRFFWLPRATFWVAVVGGLVVTLTMLLSMLPLFGTDALHRLLDLHRYSGLVAVVAAGVHGYCVVLQFVGWR